MSERDKVREAVIRNLRTADNLAAAGRSSMPITIEDVAILAGAAVALLNHLDVTDPEPSDSEARS